MTLTPLPTQAGSVPARAQGAGQARGSLCVLVGRRCHRSGACEAITTGVAGRADDATIASDGTPVKHNGRGGLPLRARLIEPISAALKPKPPYEHPATIPLRPGPVVRVREVVHSV